LGTLEGMINWAIDAINKLIESANSVAPIKIPTVPRLSIPKFAHWGMVWGATAWMQKFAFGGEVQGPWGIDKVPAMLSPWEVVLNRAQQW
jgi:hypothetical protein